MCLFYTINIKLSLGNINRQLLIINEQREMNNEQ